ncbi:hypothetical protein [Leisingera caerulea]|uniref:hypothetical protein n=1 Tax=Leisingera caerulea TaxID=506591 RepID=UPI0004195FB8|nr:hypothetical protein [Leisingera caerulea]
MTSGFEKTVEMLSGEDGPSIVVRPLFPFTAEGYRIKTPAAVEIYGEGKMISLDLPAEVQEDFLCADQIELCEFPIEGTTPVRELILIRESNPEIEIFANSPEDTGNPKPLKELLNGE